MLKALFSSNTRVKLLKTFMLDPRGEFFIRELTRLLNEQINSVRRELNNLKKIGLLKCRSRNRKKYYYVNAEFVLFDDLHSIIVKCTDIKKEIVRKLGQLGEVYFVVFSGTFMNNAASTLDLFVVGDIDSSQLEECLTLDIKGGKNIRYAIMKREDFLYRLKLNDKFIIDMLKDPLNMVAVDHIKVAV